MKTILIICGLVAVAYSQGRPPGPNRAPSGGSGQAEGRRGPARGPARGQDSKAGRPRDPPKRRIVCPKDWDVGSFKCYKVVMLETDWISALMHCIVMRSHLIDIDSKEEQTELAKLLSKNHPDLSNKRLWIDASDQSSEGQWQWMNFGQTISYTNWYAERPPPRNTNMNCGLMLGNSFLWGASECNAKYPFICEANPLREIRPAA